MMEYYTGISHEIAKLIKKYHTPANYLFSYFNEPLCYEALSNFNINILVDSGAFTLQKKGVDLNALEKYMDQYIQFIKKTEEDERIKGYFEMDLDQEIGYKNVLKIRHKLNKYSDKIIPVWHHTLGIPEFKKMVDEYPYISISCVRNKDIPPSQLKYFVDYSHKHKTKIHGLGQTNKKILHQIPFDSVDSTTWATPLIYGDVTNQLTYNSKKKLKLSRKWTGSKEKRHKLYDSLLLESIQQQKYYLKYWRGYHY